MKLRPAKILAALTVVAFASCTEEKPAGSATTQPDSPPTADSTTSHPEHMSFWEAPEKAPEAVQALIPDGYEIIDLSTGDANLDGKPDHIAVLRNRKRDTLSEYPERPEPRPLLLLIAKQEGGFELKARNDKAVLCYDCGGVFDDPFIRTVIKDGYFTVEHGISGGTHWASYTTFKYDKTKADWFLHKDHYTSYRLNDSNDPDAEAMVTDVDKLHTVKDFGELRFSDYDTYRERK